MLYNSCFLTLDALLMSRNYSPDHHTMYHFSSNDPSSRTEKRITSLPVSPHQRMLLIAPPVPGVNADSHKHSSFSKFILSIVTRQWVQEMNTSTATRENIPRFFFACYHPGNLYAQKHTIGSTLMLCSLQCPMTMCSKWIPVRERIQQKRMKVFILLCHRAYGLWSSVTWRKTVTGTLILCSFQCRVTHNTLPQCPPI